MPLSKEDIERIEKDAHKHASDILRSHPPREVTDEARKGSYFAGATHEAKYWQDVVLKKRNYIWYAEGERQFAEIQFKGLDISPDQFFSQQVNTCIYLASEGKKSLARVAPLVEALEKIKNGTWQKDVDYSEGYMSWNAALVLFAENVLKNFKTQ